MRDGGPDEDTWDELRAVAPETPRSSRRLGRAREVQERRRKAEMLLSELMRIPAQERLCWLEEKRFQEPALFELLLEQGHAALPFDAGRAEPFVTLAARLAMVFNERGALDPIEGGEGLCRALCLTGAARRLLGDFEGAEAAFGRAAFFPVGPPGRAFFCRSLGLLRWDQGRVEEAAALLDRALRWFGESESGRQEGVCRALLGLLDLEEGEAWRATPLLQQACRDLDTENQPWLAAASGLGLALCFAGAGEPKKAKGAREWAWRYYGGVRNEDALLSLYWLEGRVAAGVGETSDAAQLLGSVRRKFLARRRLPESTLATIDLGLALADLGGTFEVGALVEELATALEGRPGLDLALGTLGACADDAAAGRLNRELWNGTASALRLAFRVEGIPLRPVPFA